MPHPSNAVRKLATRLFGAGPSGIIRPFSWHARRQHENQRRGVTQPERFTGFISSESGEAFVYHAPRLLTPSGIVYAKGLLNPPATPAGIAPRIDAHCYALSPGAVAGNTCLVYCPETRVAVEESMKLWDRPIKEHPLFFAPRFPPSTYLPGTGLLVGALGIESFYHFLLECLPKLALSRRWWDSIDHFIVNGKSGGFVEKWLMHAGLPSDKLRWIGELGHFTCDQLLFTNTQTRHHYTTPPIIRRLHSMWPAGVSRPAGRKLWITRRNAHTRHLQWEDALLKQLPDLEVAELQNLSPAAQIDLMRSARLIAGPHGAGLAGMVFAPVGTKIFEFCERSEPGANACFSRLAQVTGADHYAVPVDFKKETDVGWLRGWV